MSSLHCRELSLARPRHPAPYGPGRLGFRAEPGETVAVVGTRGAGKTALLEILAGERRPGAGAATLGDRPVTAAAAAGAIGFASDPALIPPELTGVEWLRYVAAHRQRRPGDRLEVVRRAIALAALGADADRRVRSYDRAQIQALSVATAALLGDRLVLLDETLTGLDPEVARHLQRAVAELAGAGRIVLIASRDLTAVERVATRALVLRRGSLVADVRMASLLRERVAEVSLNGAGLAVAGELLAHFPGASRTGEGISVPLRRGLTLEAVLGACRQRRVPVAGSRVRFRDLEDLVDGRQEHAGGRTVR